MQLRAETERLSGDSHARREDDGRFSEEVASKDALAVFVDHESRTSEEVADELEVSRRTALNKLSDLVDRGDLQRKRVGGRAVVFRRP